MFKIEKHNCRTDIADHFDAETNRSARISSALGYLFFFSYEYKIPWLGIAVSDDVKGMHLGTRLMEFAKNYAMAHGKGGILLTTHQANLRGQMLYENSGYERLGNHYSGEVMYILRFED